MLMCHTTLEFEHQYLDISITMDILQSLLNLNHTALFILPFISNPWIAYTVEGFHGKLRENEFWL